MSQLRKPPIRLYALLVIASLFVLGLAQAAWSLRLQILGTINTSEAALNILSGFTNDDGLVNNTGLDPGDTGACPGTDREDSSCDPIDLGPGPVSRSERDVARCSAGVEADGLTATVVIDEAYPEYGCTAWFPVQNTGSLPLRIHGALLNDAPLESLAQNNPDLNGDSQPDLTLDLSGFELCQQLDPGQEVIVQLGQRILGGAPPNTSMSYAVQLDFQQWNVACQADAVGSLPEEPEG